MAKEPATSERINWKGADLRGVNMAGVNLEGADLRASDLRGTNFTGTNLRYADLRGRLQGANFQNASLYGARMQGVEAAQADFRGADMRLANLGGAYLEGAMMPTLAYEPPHPWPSEIANETRNQPANGTVTAIATITEIRCDWIGGYPAAGNRHLPTRRNHHDSPECTRRSRHARAGHAAGTQCRHIIQACLREEEWPRPTANST